VRVPEQHQSQHRQAEFNRHGAARVTKPTKTKTLFFAPRTRVGFGPNAMNLPRQLPRCRVRLINAAQGPYRRIHGGMLGDV
jgi:hypothetical protein